MVVFRRCVLDLGRCLWSLRWLTGALALPRQPLMMKVTMSGKFSNLKIVNSPRHVFSVCVMLDLLGVGSRTLTA